MRTEARLTALASTLLFAACNREEPASAFTSIRLINHAEVAVSYDVSVNGRESKNVVLSPQEGFSFIATEPSKIPTKINYRNLDGAKMGFSGQNLQLDTIRDGLGGISPQGSSSSIRFETLESAQNAAKTEWEDWREAKLDSIEIIIKK